MRGTSKNAVESLLLRLHSPSSPRLMTVEREQQDTGGRLVMCKSRIVDGNHPQGKHKSYVRGYVECGLEETSESLRPCHILARRIAKDRCYGGCSCVYPPPLLTRHDKGSICYIGIQSRTLVVIRHYHSPHDSCSQHHYPQ